MIRIHPTPASVRMNNDDDENRELIFFFFFLSVAHHLSCHQTVSWPSFSLVLGNSYRVLSLSVVIYTFDKHGASKTHSS